MSRSAEVVEAPPRAERRYVYNGEPLQSGAEPMAKVNRPSRGRKRSPFNIILTLFIVSMLIVFYVWNKIMVNRCVVEANDLQIQYQKILNANEYIRADINRKSSLERIGKIATGQLGLIYPKEQPVWFTVDFDRMENVVR